MEKPPLLMKVADWPAPITLMPLDVETLPPQVQLPAGIRTVSPSTEAVTAAATSVREQVVALTVADQEGSEATNKAMVRKNFM
jgi:hypothetical protein